MIMNGIKSFFKTRIGEKHFLEKKSLDLLTGGRSNQDTISRSLIQRNQRGRSHNRGRKGPIRNIEPKVAAKYRTRR